MSSWSAKRRFVYGGSVLLVLVLIFGIFFFKFFYTPANCSDGVKNGGESGIDCGGSCKNLCASEAIAPVVLWSKIFHISGDLYSAVSFIENPNLNSKNQKASYEFNIYDSNNKLITIVEGEASIPKGQKFAIFENGIVLKNEKPKSSSFQFTNFGIWEKDFNPKPDIYIDHSPLVSASTSPRVTGKITNNSQNTIPQLELNVFILDNNENVVAASRTFVDSLTKGVTQDFVFTWPKPFNLGVEACLNPLDVVVVLDKSGSMMSESKNPPEPFTTVINTARDFIQSLSSNDQVAITSFGTNANQESQLSTNKQMAVSIIDQMSLSTTTLEQTNIFGGLSNAYDELLSSRSNDGSKKVIVLLTDGIPTEPKKAGEPNYPVVSAQGKAVEIKSQGITVYTIGLGKDVSENFLKSISLDDAHYFFAPTKNELNSIYKKIGADICPKKPNVVNVIYREL